MQCAGFVVIGEDLIVWLPVLPVPQFPLNCQVQQTGCMYVSVSFKPYQPANGLISYVELSISYNLHCFINLGTPKEPTLQSVVACTDTAVLRGGWLRHAAALYTDDIGHAPLHV